MAAAGAPAGRMAFHVAGSGSAGGETCGLAGLDAGVSAFGLPLSAVGVAISVGLPRHLPRKALQCPGISAFRVVDLVDIGKVARPDHRQVERSQGRSAGAQLFVDHVPPKVLNRFVVVCCRWPRHTALSKRLSLSLLIRPELGPHGNPGL